MKVLCYPDFVLLIILASNVVLSRFLKKTAYFNVKCHFVYKMKIDKHERAFLLKNYAHNVSEQYVKKYVVMW